MMCIPAIAPLFFPHILLTFNVRVDRETERDTETKTETETETETQERDTRDTKLRFVSHH
jgi:hypothetical protein